MSTAAPSKRTDKAFFNPEELEVIQGNLLKGAPEHEVKRFLITCERTGLDPFSRQIYGHIQNTNKRYKDAQGKWQDNWQKSLVIITSIDGFRAIAERSGEYRGQTAPEWHYSDDEGKQAWRDVFVPKRDGKGNPLTIPDACRVGILRANFEGVCYGVANFQSFAKYTRDDDGVSLDLFWKKMPEHMIAKIAEAQGFRKAFPLLACGLFVEEEISRLDTEEEEAPKTAPKDPEPERDTIAVTAVTQKAAEAPTEPKQEKPKRASKPKPAAEEPAPGGEPEPQPEPKKEPEPEEPAEEDAKQPESGRWNDHVIKMVTTARFANRRLGDMSTDDVKQLFEGWVKKYEEKIKQNPEKWAEAQQVIAAYKAHFPG